MRVVYPNSDEMVFKRLLVVADAIHFSGHAITLNHPEGEPLRLGYSGAYNEFMRQSGPVSIFPPFEPPGLVDGKPIYISASPSVTVLPSIPVQDQAQLARDKLGPPTPRFYSLVRRYIDLSWPDLAKALPPKRMELLEGALGAVLQLQTWCTIRDSFLLSGVPFAENRAFDDLIVERLLSVEAPTHAPDNKSEEIEALIRVELCHAVLPDELIRQLHPDQILAYREQSKGAYEAWTQEVGVIQERLAALPEDRRSERVFQEVVIQSRQQLVEFQDEMKSIRNSLFGSILQTLTTWQAPALAAAYMTTSTMPLAVRALSLLAALIGPSVKHVLEYRNAVNDAARKRPTAYLLGFASL